MKKILIAICIILIIVILGIVIYINIQEQSNPSSIGEENSVVNNNVTNNEQNQSDINTTSATMEYTNAVPNNYFNKASRFSQPDNQMKAMFKLTDTFNSSNLIYLMREGGYHDMDSVIECTYNGLQRIFK